MKKIVYLLSILVLLCGCHKKKKYEYTLVQGNFCQATYWEENDTTSYELYGMCKQILRNNGDMNMCLASVEYFRNQEELGDMVCILSPYVLFDNRIFDGCFIKVGTLEYIGTDYLNHTVLIVIDKDEYNSFLDTK